MNPKKLFWLSAAGLASFGLYLLLVLRYPLGPSLDNPRASWASMVEPTWLNGTQHIAIYLGLTLLYLAALRLLMTSQGESQAPPRHLALFIFATWLACSGALMAISPAGESHDIFDYLFRGRMMAEYRANPLVEVPASYGTAPYNRYIAWRKNVDTYGPIWEATSVAVTSVVRQIARWLGWWDESLPSCPRSPESCRLLIAYLTGYRILAISLAGISAGVIASMVRRTQPSLTPLALAAWLWSPMTLLTTAVGGHNDALMMGLVLLGLWLLQRQRPFLALMTLILAAHVKLVALIWIPTCALWVVYRWGWRRALNIGLASAACGSFLSWSLYAPFGGWQTLPRMLHERSLYLANSLWRILKQLLIDQWGRPVDSAHQLSVGPPTWLFAAGAVLLSLWVFNFRPKRWLNQQVTPGEEDRKLWGVLLAASLLYLVIGSFWFQHWYILWVLGPAALLPDSRLTRSVLPWLAFGALSANVAMDFLLATTLKTSSPLMKYSLVVAMIWGPAMIAAIFHLLPGHYQTIFYTASQTLRAGSRLRRPRKEIHRSRLDP